MCGLILAHTFHHILWEKFSILCLLVDCAVKGSRCHLSSVLSICTACTHQVMCFESLSSFNYTHMHTCMHACVRPCMHLHAHGRMHTHTHTTHTHTCTRTCTHTHTHTHTRARAHTHTHTQCFHVPYTALIMHLTDCNKQRDSATLYSESSFV